MEYMKILNFLLNEREREREIIIIKEKKENEQYELLYDIIIKKFKNLTILSPNDILQIEKNDQKKYFIILLSVINKKLIKELNKQEYKEYDDYFYPRKIHLEGIKADSPINKFLGNEIIGDPDDAEIYFTGTNSKISFGKNFLANKLKIFIDSNCNIEIGDNLYVNIRNVPEYSYWHFNEHSTAKINTSFAFFGKIGVGKNSILEIGEGGEIGSNYKLAISYNSTLKIGNDCNISWDLTVVVGTQVSIFYLGENKPHNIKNGEVIIGDHVWIGCKCILLKGTHIHDGSVIGANSLVNKEIPKNCIAVGQPAKIIRKNIHWIRFWEK